MNARTMRERRQKRMQRMQQTETKQKLNEDLKNIRQHEVMEKVYQYLLEEDCSINDFDILKESQKYKFTHYEFCQLIDSIIDNFENGSIEYTEYMTYKDMDIVVRKVNHDYRYFTYEMHTDSPFDTDVSFSYEELFDIK
jgi:lipopolysaccharide biosynthesis regulator YciM